MTCMCVLHFGTSVKQQCEINKFKVFQRHGCVFSIETWLLSFWIHRSEVFIDVSHRIQCNRDLRVSSSAFYKTADYCCDYCFASWESIVGIHFRVASHPHPDWTAIQLTRKVQIHWRLTFSLKSSPINRMLPKVLRLAWCSSSWSSCFFTSRSSSWSHVKTGIL